MAVDYPGLNTLLGQINDKLLDFNKERAVMQFLADARGDITNDVTEERILAASRSRAKTALQAIAALL